MSRSISQVFFSFFTFVRKNRDSENKLKKEGKPIAGSTILSHWVRKHQAIQDEKKCSGRITILTRVLERNCELEQLVQTHFDFERCQFSSQFLAGAEKKTLFSFSFTGNLKDVIASLTALFRCSEALRLSALSTLCGAVLLLCGLRQDIFDNAPNFAVSLE